MCFNWRGLSWSEIHSALPEITVDEVLLRGGFPELYAHPEIETAGFFRSYIATYLERDLRQLLQVSNLRDYERFLRACALRTGSVAEQGRPVPRRGRQRLDGRSVAFRAGNLRPSHLAGALVFESHQVAGQDAEVVSMRHWSGRVSRWGSSVRPTWVLRPCRRVVGNARGRRIAAPADAPRRRLGLSLSPTVRRKRISCFTAAARSIWQKQSGPSSPSMRDADALLRMAAEFLEVTSALRDHLPNAPILTHLGSGVQVAP